MRRRVLSSSNFYDGSSADGMSKGCTRAPLRLDVVPRRLSSPFRPGGHGTGEAPPDVIPNVLR